MEENKFRCNECNKYYKSYQSLWNHKKKFHSIISSNIPNISPTVENNIPILSSNIPTKIKIKKTKQTECEYCNKGLSSYKNLHRHMQKCKTKQNIIKENEELKNKTKQQEQQILNIEQKLDNINNIMEDIINKTSTGIITTNNNTTNNNSNNTNNGTINNTNNNINIFTFGLETIIENLPKEDAVELLCLKGYGPLLRALMITHFLKNNPEGHNFFINDINDKYAIIYDTKTGTTIKEPIDEACDTTIQHRLVDLEELKDKHKEELNETQLNNIDYIVDNDYPPHIIDKLIKMACKNKDIVKNTLSNISK
jgi:hypothetical protein